MCPPLSGYLEDLRYSAFGLGFKRGLEGFGIQSVPAGPSKVDVGFDGLGFRVNPKP